MKANIYIFMSLLFTSALNAQNIFPDIDTNKINLYNDEFEKEIKDLIQYSKQKNNNTTKQSSKTDQSSKVQIENRDMKTNIINDALNELNKYKQSTIGYEIFYAKRYSIVNNAKYFIEKNNKIFIRYNITSGEMHFNHLYDLLSQWRKIYSDLQTYVFPKENIYERQDQQLQSIDNSLQHINECFKTLNDSKILSDDTVEKPLGSIIKLLNSIKDKMPLTDSPDYSKKFDSMNSHLFQIGTTSKAIDTFTRKMHDNISKIKEELIDNKKHNLSVLASIEYHNSLSKKPNVFIGAGEIEFSKDSSVIVGRVGITTQGLPRVSVGYQFSQTFYGAIQTMGVHSTVLLNNRTLLSGHIGCNLSNIIQLELGVHGYPTGEQNFSVGIGAKAMLASMKF